MMSSNLVGISGIPVASCGCGQAATAPPTTAGLSTGTWAAIIALVIAVPLTVMVLRYEGNL